MIARSTWVISLLFVGSLAPSQDLRFGLVTVETNRATAERRVTREHVPNVIVRFRSQTGDGFDVISQSNMAGYATVMLAPDRYCAETYNPDRTRIMLDPSSAKCFTVGDGKSANLELILEPSPPEEKPKAEFPTYKDDEAYEVYGSVLPKIPAFAPIMSIVQEETVPLTVLTDCSRPVGEFSKIAPAFDQYRAVNSKSWNLEQSLMKPHGMDVFPKSGMRTFHPMVFHVAVSAVGFNSDRTIAVFYVHSAAKYGGGQGGLFAAQKVNRQWEPLAWPNECNWIS